MAYDWASLCIYAMWVLSLNGYCHSVSKLVTCSRKVDLGAALIRSWVMVSNTYLTALNAAAKNTGA